VHVNGRTEVHSEGVCYLEWREDGRRLREAIPNHAEVLERARLKLIKLDAQGERRAQYDPRPTVVYHRCEDPSREPRFAASRSAVKPPGPLIAP
jgi:hypothetical protein